MRWPFRRRPRPEPRTTEAERRPRAGWRNVPPVDLASVGDPSVAPARLFQRRLSTRWQVDAALQPLSHDRSLAAAHGRVDLRLTRPALPQVGYDDQLELVWEAVPDTDGVDVEGPVAVGAGIGRQRGVFPPGLTEPLAHRSNSAERGTAADASIHPTDMAEDRAWPSEVARSSSSRSSSAKAAEAAPAVEGSAGAVEGSARAVPVNRKHFGGGINPAAAAPASTAASRPLVGLTAPLTALRPVAASPDRGVQESREPAVPPVFEPAPRDQLGVPEWFTGLPSQADRFASPPGPGRREEAPYVGPEAEGVHRTAWRRDAPVGVSARTDRAPLGSPAVVAQTAPPVARKAVMQDRVTPARAPAPEPAPAPDAPSSSRSSSWRTIQENDAARVDLEARRAHVRAEEGSTAAPAPTASAPVPPAAPGSWSVPMASPDTNQQEPVSGSRAPLLSPSSLDAPAMPPAPAAQSRSAWRTLEQADAERERMALLRAANGDRTSPEEAEDDGAVIDETVDSVDYGEEDYERYLNDGYSEDAAIRRARSDEALRAEGYGDDIIRTRTWFDEPSARGAGPSSAIDRDVHHRDRADVPHGTHHRGRFAVSDPEPEVARADLVEPGFTSAGGTDRAGEAPEAEHAAFPAASVQPRRRSYRLGPPLPAPARRAAPAAVVVPASGRVAGVVGLPAADVPRHEEPAVSPPTSEIALADRGASLPASAAPQDAFVPGPPPILEIPAAAAPPQDLDALVAQLYDRIRGRLRAELLIDRERAALLTDLG